MSFDIIDRRFRQEKVIGCRYCGSVQGVKMESSRTCYHFEGEVGSADDPNAPIPLCRECAREHHEYWDGMWAEYYNAVSGR